MPPGVNRASVVCSRYSAIQPLQLFPMEELGVAVLQLLIRLAGSTFRPWADSLTGGVFEITPDMSAAERIQWMIRSLAELETDEASMALQALAADEGLSSWHAELDPRG